MRHRIKWEEVALALLKLVDEGLDIGGDCFLGGLPLRLLLVVSALLFMGASPWQLSFWYPAFEKQMPNASWRRRGVATARGGGSPILGTRAKR
jgi:hypothetical protein